MTIPNLFTGARATVYMSRPGQPPKKMALFDGVDVSHSHGVAPAYVLGGYGPKSLDYVDSSTVSISASAYRSVRNPLTKDAIYPTVADLLNHEALEMVIKDRQTGVILATIREIRPASKSESIQTRSQVKNTISMEGILIDDEETANDPARKASAVEDGSATDLTGF